MRGCQLHHHKPVRGVWRVFGSPQSPASLPLTTGTCSLVRSAAAETSTPASGRNDRMKGYFLLVPPSGVFRRWGGCAPGCHSGTQVPSLLCLGHFLHPQGLSLSLYLPHVAADGERERSVTGACKWQMSLCPLSTGQTSRRPLYCEGD